jgi:ferredoxin
MRGLHALPDQLPDGGAFKGVDSEGKTLLNCMKCGACVDACKKDAAVWHLKGTPVAVKPERARLLFLYGAWAMATMFGGSILANSVATMIHWLPGK